MALSCNDREGLLSLGPEDNVVAIVVGCPANECSGSSVSAGLVPGAPQTPNLRDAQASCKKAQCLCGTSALPPVTSGHSK